jgi:beta-N-acetylhexosaminidase
LVIVHLNNTNQKPDKDFGLTPQVKSMLDALVKQNKVIINIAANPYILEKIESIKDAESIIMSYEDNEYSQSYAAQLIFGGVAATGKLPISIGSYNYGTGITTKVVRLKYTIPEEVGTNSVLLNKIDSIALKGVNDKVYPGCQVLVVKSGKVIYQKSFGYHTYDKKIKVKNDDLYDIASITKIAASTISLMKMVDDKKVGLDASLGTYLPELKGSNKENIVIREMLTHQAGLKDWIPFWNKTVNKDGTYKAGIYNSDPTDLYYKRVANNLYINKNYEDTIFKQIVDSPIKDKGKYLYSDLGYYFLKRIIEKETNTPLNVYVKNTFYAPLGLTTMGYKPLIRFEKERIAPTELDKKFRKQLVHGDVHDQGAAMMGGVGGHAGVFSNANDLAVLMQLFLNKGEYGGTKYIDSSVVSEFTKCQYCKDNRRAIGFDKPETNKEKESPVCDCVSYMSFGHAGFTGTLAWADPANQLIYIFLSNRVNPSADENKLAKSGIRTKIQEVIYEVVK